MIVVPIGMIVLLVVAALVYFGVAHRVLDRLRLTDTQALIAIGLMIVGSFIDIPLFRDTVDLSINIGGALIPAALAIYLIMRADTSAEKIRAVIASVITAAAVFGVAQLTDFGPHGRPTFLDPLWTFSLTAGIVGYLSGRSRRGSFVAGTLGIILTDLIHLGQVVTRDVPAQVSIGGAGIFDTVVISGILAVGLAEIIGETRERLQGGPAEKEGQPALYNERVIADQEAGSREVGEREKGFLAGDEALGAPAYSGSGDEGPKQVKDEKDKKDDWQDPRKEEERS